jgi:PadR family transcriptional regulator, regulatory protein AphA
MSLPAPDETLLGLLAAQASHGYDLLEAFRNPAALGRVWSMSTSQIYAVLKRLERDGLIIGRQVAGDAYAPRIEYQLTEAGQFRLRAWLDDPYPSPSVRRVRVEFLSRLYVAQRLGLDPAPIITHQRAACQRDLDRLRQERATAPVEGLALALHTQQMEMVLVWLETCGGVFRSPESQGDTP